MVGDVVDEENALDSSVVLGRESAIFLLSCSVPYWIG